MRKMEHLSWYQKLKLFDNLAPLTKIYENLLYNKMGSIYIQCMRLRHVNHNSSLMACTWMILPNTCDTRQVIFCHQRKLPFIVWRGNYDDHLIVLYFIILSNIKLMKCPLNKWSRVVYHTRIFTVIHMYGIYNYKYLN